MSETRLTETEARLKALENRIKTLEQELQAERGRATKLVMMYIDLVGQIDRNQQETAKKLKVIAKDYLRVMQAGTED